VATRAVNGTVDGSCLIITGAPAAGKSTVSRLVAEALPRSARLNGDFVHELIVSGFVWGLGEPADEAARQAQLTRKNLCALAANFVDAGFTPIVDALISDRAGLDDFLEALKPRRVLLVVLAPDTATHHQRNAGRESEEQFFFNDYETLTTTMRREFGSAGWWFDTSALNAKETAAQILDSAATLAAVDG
jgi:chloramphenicol 3-O-phosphotransferase